MKYVRNFDSFRKNKPVNEELLGGLLNWFKKMWDKAVKDLEALKDDPNEIKDWVIKNALNPKDDTNVFSQVLKDFEKKDTANDQDCLGLIDNIMDPQTGSLGKQGIGVLLANKALQGEELKAKRVMLEYIVNTARNQTIVKIKFAGGPADGKVDPKKKTIDLKDVNHLPDVKKILTDAKTDEKVKKEKTDNWVKTVLIPMIQNFVKAIKEDDIRAYLKKQGIEIAEGGGDYKEGDSVIYLLKDKTKEDWDKLTDEQKKAPTADPASKLVGVHKVGKIEGDNVSIVDDAGKEITTKTKEEIIGKAEAEKGPNAQELAKNLGEIKGDEEMMKKVNDYVNTLKAGGEKGAEAPAK